MFKSQLAADWHFEFTQRFQFLVTKTRPPRIVMTDAHSHVHSTTVSPSCSWGPLLMSGISWRTEQKRIQLSKKKVQLQHTLSANTNHALEAGSTALAHNTRMLERGELISSSGHRKLNTVSYVNYISVKLGVGSRKVKKKKEEKEADVFWKRLGNVSRAFCVNSRKLGGLCKWACWIKNIPR